MKAEVYRYGVDYTRTSCWDTPAALWVTDADVENGWVWMQCQDCMGTGHFPMPDPDLEDFCVRCKGTGLVGVSV
ncbi:hypothetical protein LCGC14_1991810 [marine sediment metagenome]|uniref:Uncharacterized protein n=1 Tax=marine sediment metagenome TaxID=412755 RepID=A0A0F9F5L7_9ZZZZ